MTATAPVSFRPRSSENPRLTFGTALRSEWRKFWTVRATLFAALTLIVLSMFMALAASATTRIDYPGAAARGNDLVAISIVAGMSISQLVMGVLAVLLVSSEYSTGMIQSTLASTPRRGLVLASKLVVSLVSGVVLGVVSWLLSLAVAVAALTANGFDISIVDRQVLSSFVTVVAYLAIIAVFSTLVAFVVRNTAASIGIIVAILFVAPIAGTLLPPSIDFGSYFLASGAQTLALLPGSASIPAAVVTKAVIVTIAWLAAAGAAAGVLFTRRDA